MAKMDKRFVQAVKAKGQTYYYFRRKGMPRVILPRDPDSVEFAARYQELLRQSNDAPVGLLPGSLHALIAKYRESAPWKALKPKTRTDYGRYCDILQARYGDLPVATLPRAFVMGLKDEFGDKPRTANYILQVMRLLLTYAVDNGWRSDNPALRPRMLKTRGTYRPWSQVQIDAYFTRHAPGSLEALAAALLLYTGQRRSDAVLTTWARYDGSAIAVEAQEKTGEPVWIPAHRSLRAILGATPRTAKTILCGERGNPMTPGYLTHIITGGARAAGIEGRSAHGLRKSAAKMLAEAGAGDAEIESILGQRAASMARKYRIEADRGKMAKTAVRKWERNEARLTAVKRAVKPEDKSDAEIISIKSRKPQNSAS